MAQCPIIVSICLRLMFLSSRVYSVNFLVRLSRHRLDSGWLRRAEAAQDPSLGGHTAHCWLAAGTN